jgi:hypothetical protein
MRAIVDQQVPIKQILKMNQRLPQMRRLNVADAHIHMLHQEFLYHLTNCRELKMMIRERINAYYRIIFVDPWGRAHHRSDHCCTMLDFVMIKPWRCKRSRISTLECHHTLLTEDRWKLAVQCWLKTMSKKPILLSSYKTAIRNACQATVILVQWEHHDSFPQCTISVTRDTNDILHIRQHETPGKYHFHSRDADNILHIR